MSRPRSLHTQSLGTFLERENFTLVNNHTSSTVDYTFESLVNGTKSTIDHFIVSDNLYEYVSYVNSTHDVENLSDHSVLSVGFNITVENVHIVVHEEAKLLWANASDDNINQHKANLDKQLINIEMYAEALYCKDFMCTQHRKYLESFHDEIISCCINASKCIPAKNGVKLSSRKPVAGWKEHVAPYKSEALYWHYMWKQIGSPNSGYLAEIRRRTRYQYHNVLRKVRRKEKELRTLRMAEKFSSADQRGFWTEIKKIKGNSSGFTTSVDGVSGAEAIASLFHDKYEHLYNCVSYDARQMATLKDELCQNIEKHDGSRYDGTEVCKEHTITFNDVSECVKLLNRGKHDGHRGHFSDHIMNGTTRLYVYLALLFDSMVSHGHVPQYLLLSTLVPIPKNKRKSLNNSDNYRAIALSSVVGKLLDTILLQNCSRVFQTSDRQYGFKQKHSTNQCTFVVNEVIQYYMNNNSNVLMTLLDASKAFDRVHYVKLFKLLISKKICPLVARFLIVLYTTSHSVSNGVHT